MDVLPIDIIQHIAEIYLQIANCPSDIARLLYAARHQRRFWESHECVILRPIEIPDEWDPIAKSIIHGKKWKAALRVEIGTLPDYCKNGQFCEEYEFVSRCIGPTQYALYAARTPAAQLSIDMNYYGNAESWKLNNEVVLYADHESNSSCFSLQFCAQMYWRQLWVAHKLLIGGDPMIFHAELLHIVEHVKVVIRCDQYRSGRFPADYIKFTKVTMPPAWMLAIAVEYEDTRFTNDGLCYFP